MVQANDVTGTPSARKNGFNGEFRQFRLWRSKIPEERIASSEWKKAQCHAPFRGRCGKKTVDGFKAGAIAANGDKVAESGSVAFIRKHRGFAGGMCLVHFQVEASFAKPVELVWSELPTISAARGWIHDCEIPFAHRRQPLRCGQGVCRFAQRQHSALDFHGCVAQGNPDPRRCSRKCVCSSAAAHCASEIS